MPRKHKKNRKKQHRVKAEGGHRAVGPRRRGPKNDKAPARRGGPRIALSVAAVTVMVAVGIVALVGLRRAQSRLVDWPPPSPSAPRPSAPSSDAGPDLDDFVGAAACGDCHADQYRAWRTSTHGRAGGLPGPTTIIAPFDGRPIRFRDAEVTPSVNAAGEYVFTIRQAGREPVVYRVDGVIGRAHMVGGGTQGFVTKLGDGTIRFLPFDFIRGEGVWFCNTGTRTDEGWVPITTAMSLVDCGDWPPVRILGAEARYGNCQECHGSQISVRFDGDSERYETHVQSFAINCESCHGPGRAHVEAARAGRLAESTDILVKALGTLDTDASLEVCFQCHALKGVIEPGYLPGQSLQEHYSLKLPLIGDRPFFPDGRVKTFAYQQNHLYSDCYLSGTMTCVDCHEPHGQGYRDIYGRDLDSRFSDGQCLSCHPSKAADITAHTHHPTGSPGSQCVSCHMPYLQHPELGDALRFSRSDHTIPIPRPAFDEAMGVENACGKCHADRSVATLQAQTDEWYGELKPHKDIIAALIEARSSTDLRNAARGLLRPEAHHPIAQVAALNELLERYFRPDMAVLDAEIVDALRRLATDDDIDVRAVALASLHLTRGQESSVRRFLVEQLETLGDREVGVRERWAITLGSVGDGYLAAGELTRAITAYRKALEVLPTHEGILLNIANAYRDAKDLTHAMEYYRRALRADPDRPLVLINMGLAFEVQGQMEEAAETYRRAIAINPAEPIAHMNLGNYYLRQDDFTLAIASYRRALELDPSLARAHYYLARAYAMTDDLEDAWDSVRRALEFEPDNPGAQQMLRDLARVLGR